MNILRTLDHWHEDPVPRAFAAGAFDGVHRGHRRLIEQARTRADRMGGEAWALTFDPHPARILRPEQAPPLLTSIGYKLRLLEACGLDGCIVAPFTAEFARRTPEEFIRALLGDYPDRTALVIGPNFRFGHKAGGSIRTLRELADRLNFIVDVVEPVQWDGAPVSSSRIRRAVHNGRLEAAEQMLGRPFSLRGPVVHGNGEGRSLGFPTANVQPCGEVIPPNGVYAVFARHGQHAYPAAAYIGDPARYGPDQTEPIVEVHLMDYEGTLYGGELEILFEHRVRGDRHFPDKESLIAQIGRDVRHIREQLAGDAPPVRAPGKSAPSD